VYLLRESFGSGITVRYLVSECLILMYQRPILTAQVVHCCFERLPLFFPLLPRLSIIAIDCYQQKRNDRKVRDCQSISIF
jgi:hypothetical protein